MILNREMNRCPSKMGFPDSSVGKESAFNAGDLGSIPGLGRSAGEGIGYPLQYSGLENSMDYTIHGVTKSQTRLSDFHFLEIQSPPKPIYEAVVSARLFPLSPQMESPCIR